MSAASRGARAYLGLGANLGERAGALQRALNSLTAVPGVSVVAVSSVYATEPVGGTSDNVALLLKRDSATYGRLIRDLNIKTN